MQRENKLFVRTGGGKSSGAERGTRRTDRKDTAHIEPVREVGRWLAVTGDGRAGERSVGQERAAKSAHKQCSTARHGASLRSAQVVGGKSKRMAAFLGHDLQGKGRQNPVRTSVHGLKVVFAARIVAREKESG